MKKILAALALSLWPALAWAQTSGKITEMPAASSLSTTDIFPVVTDPSGTPTNKKATFATLQTLFSSLFQPADADLTTWAGVTPATGIATWLATPTSNNLSSAVTNETGSGSLVFATSPTLVTPVLGVATATTINGLTITASTGALTIANGQTLTVSTGGTLGDAAYLATSTGGNGLSDSGKVAIFGAAGALNASEYFNVYNASTPSIYLALASSGITFMNTAGTGFHGNILVASLSAARTWTLPNTTGTLITTGDSGTVTGTMLLSSLDLGGNYSLEIPNSSSPTVDAFGEIAGDNNLWGASRGAPVFYDGTAAVALIGALVSDTPSDGQYPRWNTGGTITWETVSTGLTVGTTAIASGTAGRVLYETSGNVLGEITGATSDGTTLTLTAPVLGTPASGTLTNCTGLPASGVVGTAATLGANTFTGVQTLPAGSASAPAINFGTANSGFYSTGAVIAVTVGGTLQFSVASGSIWTRGSADGTIVVGSNADLYLSRPSAGVLKVAHGTTTSPASIQVWGTSTGSKYLSVGHDGTNAVIRASSGTVNVTTGGLTIGAGGAAITKVLTATATLDFSNTTPESSDERTITVTGAVSGDVVLLGVPSGSSPSGVVSFFAYVSAADTVTVRFINAENSGGASYDPASGTFRVTVIQH